MKKVILLLNVVLILMLIGCSKYSSIPDSSLRTALEKELLMQNLSISDASEVTHLDLGFGNIESLSGIEVFINLETLNISNNMITSISELKELKKLKILDIQNNLVSDLSSLRELEELKILLIRNNQIDDISVLSKRFDQYEKTDFLVKVQILDGNLELIIRELISKPEGNITINDMGKIRVLDLRNRDIIDITGIKYAKNLEKLLIDNEIENYIEISELVNLKELVITNSNLENVAFIENLNKMTVLNLSNNKIEDISFIGKLTNIKSLYLNRNKIVDISPLKNLFLLNNLYLNNNRIESYDSLGKIVNQIDDTDIMLFFFYDEQLDKAVRKATKKENGILTLDDLKSLTVLDASGFSIESIGGIENLSNLVQLVLADNSIGSLDGIEKLSKLKILDLSKNSIEELSELSYLNKLQIVNLSHNKIKDVEPLIYLNVLEYLYLENNDINNLELLDVIKENLIGKDDWE